MFISKGPCLSSLNLLRLLGYIRHTGNAHSLLLGYSSSSSWFGIYSHNHPSSFHSSSQFYDIYENDPISPTLVSQILTLYKDVDIYQRKFQRFSGLGPVVNTPFMSGSPTLGTELQNF